MKSYYIYIIKCTDNLLYTGFTNDIGRRFDEHQLGRNKSSFTYKRRPLELIFHQAIYFEKKIKKCSAKKKLALANEDFDMLQILAECINFTHSKYKSTNRRSRLRSTGHINTTFQHK